MCTDSFKFVWNTAVLDECHKFLNSTQKTGKCAQLKCIRVYDQYIEIEHCKCCYVCNFWLKHDQTLKKNNKITKLSTL